MTAPRPGGAPNECAPAAPAPAPVVADAVRPAAHRVAAREPAPAWLADEEDLDLL